MWMWGEGLNAELLRFMFVKTAAVLTVRNVTINLFANAQTEICLSPLWPGSSVAVPAFSWTSRRCWSSLSSRSAPGPSASCSTSWCTRGSCSGPAGGRGHLWWGWSRHNSPARISYSFWTNQRQALRWVANKRDSEMRQMSCGLRLPACGCGGKSANMPDRISRTRQFRC